MKEMIKRRQTALALVALGAFGIFNAACKSDRPIDGFDMLLNQNQLGQVDTARVVTSLEASFEDTVTATGRSFALSLGAFNETEARILLRFGDIPDTVEIARATLLLDTSTLLSEGRTKSEFVARVRKVNSAWDEKTVNYSNFAFDTTGTLASARIKSTVADFSASDSSFIEATRFEFDSEGLDLVRRWADPASADTHGVLIDFDQSDFIKEFSSREGALIRPRLELVVSENGAVVDTIFSIATADAYLVNRTASLQPGPLYVDNLFSEQSVIKFDLDNIPRESTINRASLILHVDQEKSVVKQNGFTFQMNRLNAFDPATDAATADSVATPIFAVVGRDSSRVRLSVLNLVQFWVTNDFVNEGLLLRTTTPGRDVTRIAFHSRNTNPELAPRLEIEFSAAPTGQ